MDLQGSVVLVTGASSGIGRAVAALLIERGATVAVSARRGEALAELGAASTHACDLSDPALAIELAEEVAAEHGRIDGAVLVAGARFDDELAEITLERLDEGFQVNAIAPILLAGRLAAGMRERGEGTIAAVVAPMVEGGQPTLGAYAAPKAALRTAMQTLRHEVRGAGVTVFTFDPGLVETALNPKGDQDPAEVAERLVGHLEAGKGGRDPLT